MCSCVHLHESLFLSHVYVASWLSPEPTCFRVRQVSGGNNGSSASHEHGQERIQVCTAQDLVSNTETHHHTRFELTVGKHRSALLRCQRSGSC